MTSSAANAAVEEACPDGKLKLTCRPKVVLPVRAVTPEPDA